MWFCTLISYPSHAIKMWSCLQKKQGCSFFNTINTGKIWFDVEYHSSIQYIWSPYELPVSLVTDKFDNTISDRIRAMGRTGGKYPLFNLGMRRWCTQCGAIGSIEPVQDY